jgi:predicted metal-dependent phosphoesterase TrpH
VRWAHGEHTSLRNNRAAAPELHITASVLDLHCHTVRGSADSQLKPQELLAVARSAGLSACCVTEHDNVWDRHEAERLAAQAGMPFLRGMEVTTDLGHIVVFGLERYVSGIRDPYRLRSVVLEAGGVMIAAHPFRNYLFDPSTRTARSASEPLEELAKRPIFGLVDEVEVLNGATAEEENLLAGRVAEHLGFRGVASSDAHSISGIGRYVTVFEREVSTVIDLVTELRAGRFSPEERAPVIPSTR